MYDLVCMGRSSIDLYSNDSGAPFPDITSFGAFVGGCPTNIAVGARRLGLSTALLTAVGDDPVGEFVLSFLRKEGVDTSYVPVKADRRTSAVVLGIEPPSTFPLVFYRDNCADQAIDMHDVDRLPFEKTTAMLLSGTGLSAEPSRTATLYAAERAAAHQVDLVLDIDFRADQWPDARTFGVNIRRLLPFMQIVIGTEEEIIAAGIEDPEVLIGNSQISSPRVRGDLKKAIDRLMGFGVEALVVKRGADGARVFDQRGHIHSAPPFKVDVENVLGAGDAFASGLLYGWLNGRDWKECVHFGNACGALVVQRQGCANFMPTLTEVAELMENS